MRSELTLYDLAVTGAIPAGLNGRYLKMGANPAKLDPAGHHWFLGDGMVHGIAIRDGKALWYRNRWIRSRLAAAALGQAAAPGPRRGRNDTVNTNVADIGGRAFALVEAGSFPVELSETLEEQRYNPFDGTLGGSFSGHPHRDPLTGEHHAIAYDGSVWDAVRHVVVSADGKVVRDVSVAVKHGPCIHDCAFTARFAIVLDLPVTFSMRAVLGGHLFPFRWNPAHHARVGLLPRHGDGTGIVWCDVEPCFVFHVANAFDGEGGQVVLDVIAYATMFASGASGLDALGRFERWTVDPATRRVARRVIDTTPQEFPRIDERRFGRSHRHVYTVSVPPDGATRSSLAPRGCTSTTSKRAAGACTSSATGTCQASSCSCRRAPTRSRTKAGSSASSSTRLTRPPTSWSLTRSPSRRHRSPLSTCRTGYRRAFTGTGSHLDSCRGQRRAELALPDVA